MKNQPRYKVVRCLWGWMVKAAEWTQDDRRWYFDSYIKAKEQAEYLERSAS